MICPHCEKEVLDFPVCTECGKPTESVKHIVTVSTDGYVNKSFTPKNMVIAVILVVSLNAVWMVAGTSNRKATSSVVMVECNKKVLEFVDAMKDEKQYFASSACGQGLPVTVSLQAKESWFALSVDERSKVEAALLQRWRSVVGDSGKIEIQ